MTHQRDSPAPLLAQSYRPAFVGAVQGCYAFPSHQIIGHGRFQVAQGIEFCGRVLAPGHFGRKQYRAVRGFAQDHQLTSSKTQVAHQRSRQRQAGGTAEFTKLKFHVK